MITTSHLQKEEEIFFINTSKKYAVNTTNPLSFDPDFPREEPTTKRFKVKVIKSGPMYEVFQYHRPRSQAVPGRKKTSLQGKEKKRMDNIHRARKTCKHLINCNRDRGQFQDKFVTLTFADSTWADLKAANYEIHKFMGRLEYQLKIKVRYVAVPEIQMERWEKYGTKVWHFHVYFFGLPYIANHLLRKIWSHGFVRINAIDKKSDVGSYVAKYMQETFTAFNENGMKRFFHSSGLREPEEVRGDSVEDLLCSLELTEECKAYGPVTYINNAYVGAVTYTRYDIRQKEGEGNGKKISDTEETPVSHSTSRLNSV